MSELTRKILANVSYEISKKYVKVFMKYTEELLCGIIAVSVTWSVIYTYLDAQYTECSINKYTLITCIILPEYFSILRSR